MPFRKEALTPRSEAAAHRSSNSVVVSRPLIPLQAGEKSFRKQHILTEDEYQSSLSQIIKRDFFPRLDRLKAENDYLTALEDGDAVQVRRALNQLLRLDDPEDGRPSTQRYATSQSPQQHRVTSEVTPIARRRGEWEDTPVPHSRLTCPSPSTSDSRAQGDENITSGILPDLAMSVSEFQARYTSEDNAAFEQLLQQDNKRRAQKYILAYNAEARVRQRRAELMSKEQSEARSGRQLAIQAEAERGNRIRSAESTLLIQSADNQSAVVTDTAPDAEELIGVEELLLVDGPRQDSRAPNSGLGRWEYTVQNALMFGPRERKPSPLEGSTLERKPRIELQNTDFREYDDDFTANSEDPGSPTSTRIDAAIRRGNTASTTSPSVSRTDSSPILNGYKFVSPYATPTTNRTQSRDEQLLRLYNASASPQGDPSSTREMHFKLPPQSRRDEIATRLGSRSETDRSILSSSHRKLSQKASTQTRQKAQLTPAARALLDRSTRLSSNPRQRTKLGIALLSREGKPQHSTTGRRSRDETLHMSALKQQRWTPSPSPIPRRHREP